MRITLFPSPFLLLAIPGITSTLANPLPDSKLLPNSKPLAINDVGIRDSSLSLHPPDKRSPKARPLADVPFDGKDGKPHAGPWVETSAGRDRKKAKESLDEEVLKPDSTDPTSEHFGPDGKPIPTSNDGVMDDPHRETPKEGTTGTGGGVSEKNKASSPGAAKMPDPPKDVPPLPHSEQQKIGHDEPEMEAEGDVSDNTTLEKPQDLPESPHSVPPPTHPGSLSDDPLDFGYRGSPLDQTHGKGSERSKDAMQPVHSFFLSLTMILVSEVGDKTFLVAALMAMRHPRMIVFSAAFTALIAMTVLSAILGHAVPTLISKSFTNILAATLFLVFGLKMAVEAKKMAPDEGVGEEMKEVEMELEEKEHRQRRRARRRSISPYALEAGRGPRKSRSSNHRLPSPESSSSLSSRGSSPSRGTSLSNMVVGVNNLCSLLLSPAWVQTFVMTFLGEWGDRSQFATIAMAAGQDYWWVMCGAVTGHGICTTAAVIGGRAIAGKVSMRVVTFGGAVAFLIFGIIYFFEALR
ncbi:UPF0016 domain-containing protein [Histoplasma ohiense]|nr:UPF0016 domain-containing protein [Histoplasma ohiense (nom. inval.)]